MSNPENHWSLAPEAVENDVYVGAINGRVHLGLSAKGITSIAKMDAMFAREVARLLLIASNEIEHDAEELLT